MSPRLAHDYPKIRFRTVWNDAIVGEWHDIDFYVFPPTIQGLKEALARPEMIAEGWDPEKLEPGGWDKHLYNHGLRLQFWVPFNDKATEEAIALGDAAGAFAAFEDLMAVQTEAQIDVMMSEDLV